MTAPIALDVRETQNGARFRVKAKPRAKREGVTGTWSDAIQVSVREPAESGRANEAIVSVLADALGLRASAITIVSGGTSGHKIIEVCGLRAASLREKLLTILASNKNRQL